ncbi:MAG TPA: sigma-70 family RNA polymerase sigma factor [Candidatus Limnocylindrales bacterium]|jgi:RNA polymerase sigma factor (sigma-70 family)|nr:sigma-70 family RNA polymerase sigma factor [Candidatus Limnocylindrales bacterium]
MTVAALRRRRPEALEELLATYGRQIQAVAYLILRDRADAEDVVIETLLTAFDKAGSIRDEQSFRAWLLKVATNHALGMRRGNARVVRLHVVPEHSGGGDLGRTATERVVLLDGIADLPAQMRAAVVLRYYADLSVDEVAAALGKSRNTVKAQLQTALDRLRISLADPTGATTPEARHA